jgi:hypothetical protein
VDSLGGKTHGNKHVRQKQAKRNGYGGVTERLLDMPVLASLCMQDVKRGEVARRVVWSSRGAQQGVACCTHAGPWLESNLFVPLPTG